MPSIPRTGNGLRPQEEPSDPGEAFGADAVQGADAALDGSDLAGHPRADGKSGAVNPVRDISLVCARALLGPRDT